MLDPPDHPRGFGIQRNRWGRHGENFDRQVSLPNGKLVNNALVARTEGRAYTSIERAPSVGGYFSARQRRVFILSAPVFSEVRRFEWPVGGSSI